MLTASKNKFEPQIKYLELMGICTSITYTDLRHPYMVCFLKRIHIEKKKKKNIEKADKLQEDKMNALVR